MLVTKRNGTKVAFDVAKIKESVERACEGLDVNPLAIEAKFDEFLFDGISTKQINQNMIHHTKTLAGPKSPDYVYVAGRLETMDRWAATGSYDISFTEFVREQRMLGLWKHEGFNKFSEGDIEELGECIVQERDLAHSISSVMTANGKYFLANECLQHLFMGNAMVIASVEEEENRMDFTKEVYAALSERKVSLATPWNINLRSGGNISSCFTMELSDNIDSIFDNLHDAARISKNGGGLGVCFSRMRAKGSDLMGAKGASGGMLGWNKLFNDTAVSVNQGGKRKGAFTTSLPIWHGDIEAFLDSQSEHGDQRGKSHDVKPQVLIPDYFMVLKDDEHADWHLFCPHEVEEVLGIQLFAVYGEEFKQAYLTCVKAYQDKLLKVVHVVKAKALYKAVMKRQFETGLPYIGWICRMNEMNPNKHVGNIATTNLCVAPETQILTDQGYTPIVDLVGETANVWNGEEWSSVEVVKTGENQKLLTVVTDSGQKLDCTEYHKFYTKPTYRGPVVEKRAYELKPGDKLIKFDLPVIEGWKTLDKAYTNGLFTGDGTQSGGRKLLYLYHGKRSLKEFTSITKWKEDENQNRSVGIDNTLKDKFFVPDASYTIESRLSWLAGLLDSDGCVCRNGTNESLQLASVEPEFLRELQLMLQTLGVASKIKIASEEGMKLLPANDGTGESKMYPCRKSERILVSSNGLYKLSTLGLETHRLKWEHRLPQREAEHFIAIEEVIDHGRYDDTYCFTEHKRGMGVFGGILTGQCTESYSVTVPEKYQHTCNLASIVMGRVGIDEIEYYAGLTAHILDNGIALTNPPTEESRAHNETFRTIGVGIQGYADLIAREWKSFLDTDYAADIAERIQLGCVKEGLRLAKVRGAYPEFGGSTWSTGEQIGRYIEHSKTRKDEWEALNTEVQMYGVRNSQFTSPAPNTTTSIFMDAGAGVMPVYGAFFYEDNTEGLIPVSAMYIKENPVSYMKDVTTFKPWDLAAVVGAMQYPWIDTGISSEYIMDKNQPGFKAKWLWDTLQASWENKNKAVYYIRTVKVGEKLVKGAADCVGCDG